MRSDSGFGAWLQVGAAAPAPGGALGWAGAGLCAATLQHRRASPALSPLGFWCHGFLISGLCQSDYCYFSQSLAALSTRFICEFSRQKGVTEGLYFCYVRHRTSPSAPSNRALFKCLTFKIPILLGKLIFFFFTKSCS